MANSLATARARHWPRIAASCCSLAKAMPRRAAAAAGRRRVGSRACRRRRRRPRPDRRSCPTIRQTPPAAAAPGTSAADRRGARQALVPRTLRSDRLSWSLSWHQFLGNMCTSEHASSAGRRVQANFLGHLALIRPRRFPIDASAACRNDRARRVSRRFAISRRLSGVLSRMAIQSSPAESRPRPVWTRIPVGKGRICHADSTLPQP